MSRPWINFQCQGLGSIFKVKAWGQSSRSKPGVNLQGQGLGSIFKVNALGQFSRSQSGSIFKMNT